ncbi:MAG: hypothetical protein HYT87_06745 [Nitrospirae bacterium]|nr:hypothetical protein [Nitrospirota bacterium]
MTAGIAVEKRDRAMVVTPATDTDLMAGTEVRAQLHAAVKESKFIILDLSALRSIDWDVVGLLLELKKAHRSQWGTHVHHFKLVAGPGHLRKLIAAMQMDHILPAHASVDEALATLPRRRALHVEPDADLASLVEILLESNGFEVMKIRRPEELPDPEGERFDVVLTETVFEGRTDPGWVGKLCLDFGCPVGVLTGSPGVNPGGADFVLEKPVHLKRLMDRIHLALERPLRHFYEKVFDELPSAMLLASASEGRITCNRAWISFFAVPNSGSSIGDLPSAFPSDFPAMPRIRERIAFVAKAGGTEDMEIHWPGNSGLHPPLHITISGVGFLEGESQAMVLAKPQAPGNGAESWAMRLKDAEDVRHVLLSLIEDLDGARANLRSANDRLQEVDRLKDEFVSTVSHELRTPMTAIKGSTENLLDGFLGPVSEEQKSALKVALRNSKRLARLIDNLLDLSKMDAGRMEFRRRRTDLRDSVRLAVEDLQSLVGKSGMALDLRLPDASVVSEIDPDRMAQVVSNLVDNAIRFARSRVTVRLESVGQEAHLAVEDDGPGIPMDAMDRIFDRFGVVKGAGEKAHTGLGLSIVRAIVEAQGGKVWAENLSDEIGGARFALVLPLVGSDPRVEAVAAGEART